MRPLAQPLADRFPENLLLLELSVYKKNFLESIEPLHPLYEAVLVRMCRKAVDGVDGCPDNHLFMIYMDMPLTLYNPPSERALRLVSDKQKGVSLVPEPMLEVVEYPAAGTHAAAGYDDGTALDFIDLFGLFGF